MRIHKLPLVVVSPSDSVIFATDAVPIETPTGVHRLKPVAVVVLHERKYQMEMGVSRGVATDMETLERVRLDLRG